MKFLKQTLSGFSNDRCGTLAAAESIAAIMENGQQDRGKWWKTLVSFVGIILGATGVVSALQDALNQVWGVKPNPETSGIKDTLWKRLLSFGMILGLGFLLLVSLVVSCVLSAMGNRLGSFVGMSEQFAELVNFGVQAIVVFVIFAAIFKFMPDAMVMVFSQNRLPFASSKPSTPVRRSNRTA